MYIPGLWVSYGKGIGKSVINFRTLPVKFITKLNISLKRQFHF